MKPSLFWCSLLACISPLVSATALTYKLSANEKACFYSNVDKQGAKIAFYFAVQAGGSFDVDYEVVGPNERVIMKEEKERQGDFVFTATEVGEYRFCFNNQMSTFSEKFVDFEIAVENEPRASIPSKQGTTPEQTSALEESIFKLSGQLSTITRNQKYFRTRENRNFSTVRSTERRIFNFSVIESLMMMCMAALQVFIVRFFFQVRRSSFSIRIEDLTRGIRALEKVTCEPFGYGKGEEEEIPQHAQQRGPRILGAGALDDAQIVLKKIGPPSYGNRTGWRPRGQEDFGDGGAFPEIPVAQYPLDMGRKSTSSNNALALQVDGEGKVKYDAIARQGHNDKRIVHASFKDLIPLRQRADAGDVNLDRPSEEEVAASTERTKNALATLVSGAVAAQKPKNVNVGGRKDPTYVRYTPANQMGDNSRKNDRIMKIVERQQDPMEPPKFKHKKIPRGPPSPPAPVMHSPPRKLTAEDQEAWKIPPPVSNWKNPKGYTVPLDKRLAADGRGLQDVTINDKFAQFAEALFTADRHAREEVKQRALMQQRLAEKEKSQKEDHLRMLAQKAREERAGAGTGSGRRDSRSSRSRSGSYSDSESEQSNSDDEEFREREKMRQEKRRDEERKLRQSRMGAERRIQMMAREQNRDISEKVALGLAKPTQSAETMFDSRLFNRTSGFDSGFNEDQAYDKPLFAAQDAISSIYRPRQNMDDDDDEAAAEGEMAKIQKSNRFGDALGKGTFRGAADVEVRNPSLIMTEGEANFEGGKQAREGPVQFEKDIGDVFNVDDFLSKVGETSNKREYGLQEDEERSNKRARVDENVD
ncbi:transcriptional regulator Cwf13/SkiP [Sclerotinia borealis F-4128]|uniref:Pre-mRNA-processing protein 45 n=1 Tax=Sclerotinia borealis (strain F-4128) TaxID=1432307 RepID=W9CFP7_SCLBF|nr:transcriptional regulator Cwf13/SkiP [Sclerotinia borealis F-4128]